MSEPEAPPPGIQRALVYTFGTLLLLLMAVACIGCVWVGWTIAEAIG